MTKLKNPAVLLFVALSLLTGSCKKSNPEPEPEPKPTVFDCSPWTNITGEVSLTNEVGKAAISLYNNPFIGWQVTLESNMTWRKELNASHICAVNEGLQKKLFKDIVANHKAFEKDKLKYEYILINRSFVFRIMEGEKIVARITWLNPHDNPHG